MCFKNCNLQNVCSVLFLLLVCGSEGRRRSRDLVKLEEAEACEGPDGTAGICTPVEQCRTRAHDVTKLPPCSNLPGPRTICCPKTNHPQASRHRRYTWNQAPYSQTQSPTWHYSHGYKQQNYYNDYNNQNYDSGNNNNFHNGYYNGYPHQNHNSGYNVQNPNNGYNNQNWHYGYHNGYPDQNYYNGHSEHNYNNGYDNQNSDEVCDHDDVDQNTGDNDHSKHEHSNHNLQDGYNSQNSKNSDRNSDVQNVNATQSTVSTSQTTTTDGANRNQGTTAPPTSETVASTTLSPFPHRYTEPNPEPSALRGARISERKCVEYMDRMTKMAVEYNVFVKTRCAWHRNPNITRPDYYAIYLGFNSTRNEFPHMVALGWTLTSGGFDFKCGGTLISESYVLTAGHCLYAPGRGNTTASPVPTIVRLGDYVLDDSINDGTSPVTRRVKRTLRHPSYKPPVRYFDLGLIEMTEKVELTLEVRPACLWTEPDSGPYRHAVVTGWGKLSSTGAKAHVLQSASLELFENPKCAPLLENARDRNWRAGLADTQLCAGDLVNGTDTCQGDSGSALAVAYRNNQCLFFVMGVTSFGRPCGTLNSPGVYTRVSSFVSWIESVVWNDAADTAFD